MTPYESAITVIAIISILYSLYQGHQAKVQRRIDYLRELQKELREEKAEYDGWEPVWNVVENGNDPARHGAKVCSKTQSVMLAADDSELNRFAKELKLRPNTHSEVQANQGTLQQATSRFAKLLHETWTPDDFRKQDIG